MFLRLLLLVSTPDSQAEEATKACSIFFWYTWPTGPHLLLLASSWLPAAISRFSTFLMGRKAY